MPEANKKLIENLLRCGVKKNEGVIVEFLSRDHEYHSLRDIERACDLRQPEVSIVVTRLALLLDVNLAKKEPGKGRPIKSARLTEEKFAAYIDSIKTTIEKEYGDRIAAVVSLIEA